MVDMIENLRQVQSYCENQGDKFHPLSDKVLEAVTASGTVAEKETAVRALVEGEPDDPYHVYHTNRIINYLEFEEEEW